MTGMTDIIDMTDMTKMTDIRVIPCEKSEKNITYFLPKKSKEFNIKKKMLVILTIFSSSGVSKNYIFKLCFLTLFFC